MDSLKKEEKIIINRMYAGEYLLDNIGHEILNTYKTDNNENYIYINPWGTIKKEYKNAKYVLLVRGVDQHCFEVIAYAGKLECLISNDGFKSTTQRNIGVKDNKTQINYIKNNIIKYGGIYVNDLFSEQKNVIYATFKANQYRNIDSKSKIFIVDKKELENDTHIYIPGIKFSKQSLHMYTSKDEKTKDAYEALNDFIENKDKEYFKNNRTKKVNLNKKIEDNFSVLDIIGKNYDELAFSNWIAYYLNNDLDLLNKFVKKVLKIKEGIDINNIKIKREYNNIDIWIEDTNSIIVIENKIKSGINGVYKEKHDLYSNKVKSQLSNYVKTAQEESKLDELNRECKFYILLPNYSYTDKDLQKYDKFEEYTIIKYDKQYDFFSKNKSELPYYGEFIKSIKKHISPYPIDLFEIMDDKLIQKIKNKGGK